MTTVHWKFCHIAMGQASILLVKHYMGPLNSIRALKWLQIGGCTQCTHFALPTSQNQYHIRDKGNTQWAQKVKPSGLASFVAKKDTQSDFSQKLIKAGLERDIRATFLLLSKFCTTSVEVWKLKLGDFGYSRNPAWLYLGGR